MTLTIKTIVAAVDVEDDLAGAILKTAADLAHTFGAALHAVDVVRPMSGFESPYAMGAVAADLEAQRKAEEANLNRLAGMVSTAAPSARPVVVHGAPGHAVADYARKNHADLLVIGSHQKGWWETITTGSASTELVHDAPCAVFVVTKDAAKKA
jgi:nucleotide-binding universal stress UspA family protein